VIGIVPVETPRGMILPPFADEVCSDCRTRFDILVQLEHALILSRFLGVVHGFGEGMLSTADALFRVSSQL
jgi:hypothetical protein